MFCFSLYIKDINIGVFTFIHYNLNEDPDVTNTYHGGLVAYATDTVISNILMMFKSEVSFSGYKSLPIISGKGIYYISRLAYSFIVRRVLFLYHLPLLPMILIIQ